MTPDKTVSRTRRRSCELCDLELEVGVGHRQAPKPEEMARCIGIFIPECSHTGGNRHSTEDKELE